MKVIHFFIFCKIIFVDNSWVENTYFSHDFIINDLDNNLENIIHYDIQADENTTGLLIGTTIKKYSL